MSEAREFKMPFGKYKGLDLEEIYVRDKGYLEYIYENVDDKPELTEKIADLLEEMKDVRIY